MFYLQVTVTLNLTSDLVFRIIMPGSKESQTSCVSASWDGGVSLFHFGVTVTFDLVSRINIESGAYFGII